MRDRPGGGEENIPDVKRPREGGDGNDFGADANVKDSEGRTPLYHSSSKGQVDAVKKLISSRATIDLVCNTITPLNAAIKNGHVRVVRHLLKCNADVNHTNVHGLMPIFESIMALKNIRPDDASRRRRTGLIKLLVRRGATWRDVTYHGITPSSFAALAGYPRMEAFLQGCRNTGCAETGTKKCRQCLTMRYCSQVCFNAHWTEEHKESCRGPTSTSSSSSSSTNPNRHPLLPGDPSRSLICDNDVAALLQRWSMEDDGGGNSRS
jgi:ankyrin repeat protein